MKAFLGGQASRGKAALPAPDLLTARASKGLKRVAPVKDSDLSGWSFSSHICIYRLEVFILTPLYLGPQAEVFRLLH